MKPVDFSVTPMKGTPLCKFDVAIPGTHPQLGIPIETTIHVVTWSDLADNVGQHVSMDDNLELTGRFETRPYTSNTGQQREWTEFTAFEIKRGDVRLGNDGFKRVEGSFLPPDQSADITPDFTPEEVQPEVESDAG
jgi:single-stranded DNA-binding protein